MTFSNGYSMDVGSIKLDGLGKLYISIAVAWTAALIPGAVVLLRNRRLPYLRIRNVPLALSSVATLHVYLILCLIVYVLGGNFPCQTEFWIMSIYLPLGIALYQAANTQLLHISALQKKFALSGDLQSDKKQPGKKGWRNSMEIVMSYSPTKRTLTFVAAGMIMQVSATPKSTRYGLMFFKFAFALVVFLISRKFNYFGIVGSSVDNTNEGRAACRKGWEW